ncbi:unnamed protein product, partial [Dicrocoelium dendriticum]
MTTVSAFSGGKDSTIIKWCIKEFRRIQTVFGGKRSSSYPFHTGPILSIAISSDCKYLV